MATIGLRKWYTATADYWADVNNAIQNSMGWTLHDDIDTDTKVYKSNGEDADKPYIYVKLSLSADTITTQLWLYWDAATHAGTTETSSNTSFYITTSTYNMIGGNKDMFYLYRPEGGLMMVGFLNRKFYTAVTNITADAAAGNNVDVAVASSANFMKGGKCQIVGINDEGRDLLTVTTIPDNTHITFNNIPRNYASGAFLGITPCPAFLAASLSCFLLCPYNGVGNANSPAETYNVEDFITLTDIDPDSSHGYYVLAPWKIRRAEAVVGYCDAVVLRAPAATEHDTYTLTATGAPEQGTASSATSTTLTDAAKAWEDDVWTDKYAVIADGTGNGQARKISSNTATELTITTAWDMNPDATSTYRIVDAVYRSVYATDLMAVLEDRHTL